MLCRRRRKSCDSRLRVGANQENISIVKIMQLVVIGGALSILVSLVLFEISPFLGVLGASAAGPVEEVGKLLALLLALKAAGLNRYKYRLNALLLGAAVGTGFAAFESAGYALRYGLTEGSDSMLGVIEMRGALSPFSHIVWTAIAASAYWINRPLHNDFRETVFSKKFLALFAVPVGLHFIWNLPFHGPFMTKFVILGFIAWVVVISLIQSGLREVAAQSRTSESTQTS
jgi:RsiW-degrading membrane proteinase PrsW (M82 family)